MKKMLKMMLCLLLAVMSMSAACAEGVELAAQMLEAERFSHYPSYVCDETTGRWSVNAYQADALVDRFWNYGIKNSNRIVVFHLAAEGDAHTGVWTPVLRFYHMDGKTISARAVSVLVDGERFDLAASSTEVRNGRYTAECITVPLNGESVSVAEKMASAEQATVRLIGEEVYTVEYSNNQTSSRAALESESLAQMASGVALLRELGVTNYALWDLSAAAWEKAYGYCPAVTKGTATDALPDVDDAMGMVLPDDTGTTAQAAQQTLAEYGFLSGTPSRTFDENAVHAVLRAQTYLNRVPTGCFDAALMNALAQGRTAEAESRMELLPLGSTAQLALSRYWFADAVCASRNSDSVRSVANADNVLLIADGMIRNTSAKVLHLFMHLEASVVYNGQYTYAAELVCEGSGGTELNSWLLPLAQTRLMVYAEIPQSLAQDQQAEWSIVFGGNGESLAIELQ